MRWWLLGMLLLLWGTTGQAAWDDPGPQVLLYADFENPADLTPIGTLTQQRVVQQAGKFGQGLNLTKPTPLGSILPGTLHQLDPLRGTMTFWFKLNTGTMTTSTEVFSVFPGPPVISTRFTPDTFTITIDEQIISTGTIALTVGAWHHLAWVWWGMNHYLYFNGTLVSTTLVGGPMISTQGTAFRLGLFLGGTQDAAIDEFTIYNCPLTQAEITTLATAVAPGTITSFAAHGLLVQGQWAPGDKRVHVAIEAGNDHVADATQASLLVKNAALTTLATGTIPTLRRGFGEVIVPLATMPPDTYHIEVTLKDETNATLQVVTSSPFVVPSTPWLGNSLGISSVIQAPWTPIVKTGNTLAVIGRTIDLDGGFGLPMQMTSQGKALLATPLTLELLQPRPLLPASPTPAAVLNIQPHGTGASQGTVSASATPALPTANHQLTFTSVTAEEVTWAGTAQAGNVQIEVQGRLEYDGLLLFTVRLTPLASSVPLHRMRLQMAMPLARALWMNTATEQIFWWYPYKAATGMTVGTFHTNLLQTALTGRTTFLPSVVFSDNDVGLEWFAESPAGWQVDETLPMQEMLRDPGQVIRLQNNLANKAFTLSQPLDITFGLMATPTKPMPSDWRLASAHHHVLPVTSDLHLWWAWPTDVGGACCRQGDFNLYPVDLPGWNAAWASRRATGVKIAPFINGHVEIPHGTDTWASLQAILHDETQNDGWIAQPTRGMQDYYLYQLNQWFAGDGLDAIYIDETYMFGATRYLLAGGYIREDGTHGYGYTNLGIRRLLKRIRQLFVDHSLRPLVWVHNTAIMWPHLWSFVDIMSDGEGHMFEAPTDPDWIDIWGFNLLTPSVGPSTDGGPWLLSSGRTQKFGAIPFFLNYIKFFSQTAAYNTAIRTMHALLLLLDILPMEYTNAAGVSVIPQVKEAFGITAADVTFHGYWEQTAITTSRADVKVSYYQRPTRALAAVTNLGEAFSGQVLLNLAALGLAGATVTNAETSAVLPAPGGVVTLTMPRHDYLLLRIDAP